MTAFPVSCASFLPWRIPFPSSTATCPWASIICTAGASFPWGAAAWNSPDGQLQAIHALESPWNEDYILPDLSVMEISWKEAIFFPSARGTPCRSACDGQSLVFEPESPEELLREFSRLLQRDDPDLIVTDYGDSFLIPSLLRLAQRWRVPLPFDREPTPIRRAVVTEGRSYFTYGQIVYNAPDYPFFGRLHIDRENSFFFSVTGWEGIVEAARLSKIPIQRLARRGSGTAISSMQLDRAIQDEILIPWRKGEPEKFKTAWDLLVADKGGLTFQPAPGHARPRGRDRLLLHVSHDHGAAQHLGGDDPLRLLPAARRSPRRGTTSARRGKG